MIVIVILLYCWLVDWEKICTALYSYTWEPYCCDYSTTPCAHLEEEVELLPALVAQVVLRVQVLGQVVHAQREVLGRKVLRRNGGEVGRRSNIRAVLRQRGQRGSMQNIRHVSVLA